MKKLCHANIVRLYECIDDPAEGHRLLGDAVRGRGGPLVKFDEELHCPPMSLPVVRSVMQQLASALVYLHARGIVHMDIKPDNILVDRNDGRVLLSDFGVSALSSVATGRQDLCHFRGTPLFAPPEAFAEGAERQLGPPADLWATGVTLYAMIFGCLPFTGESVPSVIRAIVKGELQFPPTSPDKLKWRKLISMLLEPLPQKRITAKELEGHPILTGDASVPSSPFGRRCLCAVTEEEINTAVRTAPRNSIFSLPRMKQSRGSNEKAEPVPVGGLSVAWTKGAAALHRSSLATAGARVVGYTIAFLSPSTSYPFFFFLPLYRFSYPSASWSRPPSRSPSTSHHIRWHVRKKVVNQYPFFFFFFCVLPMYT